MTIITQGLLGNDYVTQGYGVAEAAPVEVATVRVPGFGTGKRKGADKHGRDDAQHKRDVDMAVGMMLLEGEL